ncbi:MAG: hypothetical protein AAFO04_29790 [Cyanobacteria bacterium J06592_8]
MSQKPNFSKMSLTELRRYVLIHRDDSEAWKEFANRPRPNAVYFDADLSQSEQETKLRELLGD